MRIGIIIYGLDRPLSGISRYTLELVRALTCLPDAPEIILLTAGGVGPLEELGLKQVSLPVRLLPGLLVSGNIIFPMLARRLQLDIMHDPTGITPFLFGSGRAKSVVTIHDVIPWSFPGVSTTLDRWIYRYWLPRVVHQVDCVMTDSQASKTDIVHYLKITPEKVHVSYPGVKPMAHAMSGLDTQQTIQRYGLPEKYILFLGSVEERKNLSRVLAAYHLLRQKGITHHLVIAGGMKWKYASIMETVTTLQLADSVIFTGYVDDNDLPNLYRGAELFVFPSLYEGFGLPVIEAMIYGTPVVTSHSSSLPEVGGEAALFVDPYNVEELAQAMYQLLTTPMLQQELRQKGLEHARQFTWERTARETLHQYKSL